VAKKKSNPPTPFPTRERGGKPPLSCKERSWGKGLH